MAGAAHLHKGQGCQARACPPGQIKKNGLPADLLWAGSRPRIRASFFLNGVYYEWSPDLAKADPCGLHQPPRATGSGGSRGVGSGVRCSLP